MRVGKSNIKSLVSVVIISVFSLSASAQEPSLMGEARQWYSQRANVRNGHKVNSYAIDQAIDLYRKILVQARSEPAIEGLLSSYHFKLSYADLEEYELRLLSEEAVAIGEKAKAEYPGSAAVMYWYASLLSKWAEYHGIISSNNARVPERIKSLSESVIELSPDYRWNGGYRILGLLHCMTPRIPFLFDWVSREVSLSCLERASYQHPEHLGNLFGLAKIYTKKNRKGDATALLKKISITPPRSELLMEDLMIIHRANKMIYESYTCNQCFKYISHEK